MGIIKTAIVLMACAYLGACASIVSGTQQSLFIDTPLVDGATCKLADSKSGSWYLASTPGSVSVQKGNGPMNVVCEKADYYTGVVSSDEETAGATFGNILLGGGIGIFVDAATGAAQKYPDKVVVWMKPKEFKTPAEEVSWNDQKHAFDEAEQKAKDAKEARRNQSLNNAN